MWLGIGAKMGFRAKNVGLCLRGFRIMSGDTREFIASEWGVSVRTYSRWEAGSPIPFSVLSFLRRKWGEEFWQILP